MAWYGYEMTANSWPGSGSGSGSGNVGFEWFIIFFRIWRILFIINLYIWTTSVVWGLDLSADYTDVRYRWRTRIMRLTTGRRSRSCGSFGGSEGFGGTSGFYPSVRPSVSPDGCIGYDSFLWTGQTKNEWMDEKGEWKLYINFFFSWFDDW